jgi:hypothetical protein
MHLHSIISLGALVALPWNIAAQFPAKPSGVTVLDSQIEDGIRISYKEVKPPFKTSLFDLSLTTTSERPV